MSMLPVFLRVERPAPRNQQQLVFTVSPDGALSLLSPPSETWNPTSRYNQPSIPKTLRNSNTTENFEVNLDMHHFAPEDITVKTIDGFLLIEASHDEKRDEYGWVKRQFSRRYALPEGCQVDAIESRLSSDGVLTVYAPSMAPRNERQVPIVQTGPVRGQVEAKLEIGDGEAPEAVEVAATLQ